MKNTKGFTLVELMVVIAIIAILAVGSITGYSSYIKKARDNTRVTELKAVENALTAYMVDNGAVPADKASADAAILGVNGKTPTQPNTDAEDVIDSTNAAVAGYQYATCDNNTNDFLIRVAFESTSIGAAKTDRDGTTEQILELGSTTPSVCDSSGNGFVWVTLADTKDA